MGATPSTTLTLTSSQTTAQSLNIPNITAADQMTTDKFATTLFNKGFVGGTSYSTSNAGTVTVSGTTVTGSGTSFSPGMAGGTFIASNGASGMIYHVDSNTSLTLLDDTIAGGPGVTYNIYYNNFVVDPSYGAGTADFFIGNNLLFTNGLNIEIDQASNTNTLTIATNPLASGNWTIIVPSITVNDTLVADNFPATLTNKNLSDSTTYVIDAADATKRIGFDVTGTSGMTLTVTSGQTTSQILNLPNITQTDTAIVSFLPQTAYKKVMIGGQDAFSSTLNTAITPSISVPSNTNCQNIAFSPDGLTAYVANNGSNNVLVYSLKTNAFGDITPTLSATWSAPGVTPTGICFNTSVGGRICVTSSITNNYVAFTLLGTALQPNLALPTGSGYPVSSRDGNYVYVTTTSAISIIVADGSSKTDIITGTITGLSVSLAKGVAAASNGTEVYIIQGNLTTNVSYFTISGGTGTTPAGSVALSGGVPRYIVADKQRNFVYAADVSNIFVISTTSKTVTNTIAVSGATLISYLSIANDNTYMYITDTGATKKIHMLNLSTLAATTIINPISSPTTPLTAVPTPDNSALYIVGNDAAIQIAAYDIKKSQYVAYSVGQASQTGSIIDGFLGTEWNKQMIGGVIVFANGVTCDVAYDPDNVNLDSFTTKISQTVTQQNYTIFYKTTLVSPIGSGTIGDGTVLINPTIAWKGDTTNAITFDMSANAAGSGLILTTSQSTANVPQILTIPDLTTSDTMMTLGTNQTITGTKTFNTAPAMTSIFNGGTVTIPTGTDTFTTITATQTLTNKSLSDATTFITDDVTATKRLGFQIAGNTAGVTLTLATAQAISQSLAIPNVGAGDSFVTLNAAQTLTNKNLSDATTFIVDDANNTRRLGFSISNDAGITLTIATAQTNVQGSQSLAIPPVLAGDSFATLNTIQTVAGIKTFSLPQIFTTRITFPTASTTTYNPTQFYAYSRSGVGDKVLLASTTTLVANTTTENNEYQPHQGTKNFLAINSVANSTTLDAQNCVLTSTGTVGTNIVAVAPGSTVTTGRRINYVTTVVNTGVGFNTTNVQYYISSAGPGGGFHFICRFINTSLNASGVNGSRVYIGLANTAGMPPAAATEPSAIGGTSNKIGIFIDSGDANFQVMASSSTTTLTGKTNFSSNVAKTTVGLYEFRMYSAPGNTANVYCSLYNVGTGTAPITANVSSNLPTTNALLYPVFYVQSTGATAASTLSLVSLYCESNL